MAYCSKIQCSSKLEEFAGVTWLLHRMTEYRRVSREIAIADLRVEFQATSKAADETRSEFLRVMDLRKRVPVITDIQEQAPDPELEAAAAASQSARLAWDGLLSMKWKPAWIRWGLVSIDGFVIDDHAGTIGDLVGPDGPDDLVQEVFQSILEASGLGAAKTKNLPSPGTSADPADGKTSDSTATSAEPPAGTTPASIPQAETVPSISPKT